MKAIGIKELKAKLSEYLRLVKSGEVVLITERSEVIAELKPARRQPVGPKTLREKLEILAEQGKVTLASKDIKDWKGFRYSLELKPGVSSQDLLDAVREDRV